MSPQSRCSTTPPAAVRAAFRTGLRLHRQGRSGSGLRPQTVKEARALAEGTPITRDKAVRMDAWFARHAVDKRPGWSTPGKETPGYTAHMLWGGAPARRWVKGLRRCKGW